MSARLELTFEARADLAEIWRYIARDDDAVADIFLDKLHTECVRLTKLKAVGRSRPELGEGVLSYPFKRYVVYFLRDGKRVTILRVLHGSRDQSSVFGP